jgi:hypothetical protein
MRALDSGFMRAGRQRATSTCRTQLVRLVMRRQPPACNSQSRFRGDNFE